MAVQHRNITDIERHEAKGASTATNGQVLKANGDTTTSFVNPNTLINITAASSIESNSVVSQSPTSLDTPLQVNFGTGASNSNASINVDGTVVFTVSGLYYITINLNLGRSSNTGVAFLAARLLINGTPIGITQATKIDTSMNIVPFNASLLRSMASGDVLTIQIIRDSGSSGQNDGGLLPIIPATSGWASSPSASIRVQKIQGGA